MHNRRVLSVLMQPQPMWLYWMVQSSMSLNICAKTFHSGWLSDSLSSGQPWTVKLICQSNDIHVCFSFSESNFPLWCALFANFDLQLDCQNQPRIWPLSYVSWLTDVFHLIMLMTKVWLLERSSKQSGERSIQWFQLHLCPSLKHRLTAINLRQPHSVLLLQTVHYNNYCHKQTVMCLDDFSRGKYFEG